MFISTTYSTPVTFYRALLSHSSPLSSPPPLPISLYLSGSNVCYSPPSSSHFSHPSPTHTIPFNSRLLPYRHLSSPESPLPFLSNAHSYLSHSTVNLSSLYHSLPSSPITFYHQSTVSTISYHSLLTHILTYDFLPSIYHLSTIPYHP